MPHIVVVTGATGQIGRALAGRLLEKGVKVRAIARHADKLEELAAKGAEALAGDLEDTAFLTEAFRGADAVFAMIPPNTTAPDLRAEMRKVGESIASAIEAAGVRRVVALSSAGANLESGTGPIVGLHEFEERLKALPDTSVVVLRPTYFMENFLASIPLIKSAGINGGPIRGDVPVALIATRDIADAAAEYLANPTFQGHTVRELLGPRDYTFREATSILGTAIGKPDLPYVEVSFDDFRKSLLEIGFSGSVADAYVEMEKALDDSTLRRTMNRTEQSTTRTTLEQFASDVFRPAYQAEGEQVSARPA